MHFFSSGEKFEIDKSLSKSICFWAPDVFVIHLRLVSITKQAGYEKLKWVWLGTQWNRNQDDTHGAGSTLYKQKS